MSGAGAALGVRAFNQQAVVGLSLAALIVAAWGTLHVYGVFYHRWSAAGIAMAPLLIMVQCWLNVGLFIIAHDCMHGSVAPLQPRVNRWVGRVVLGLYAGFWYDQLLAKHHLHHRHAGTADDPDFDENHPDRFWPWYRAFFSEYFGWRPFAVLTGMLVLYIAILGASPVNALLMWGVPALLSSVQLFTFGTFLPHRHADDDFTDRHRARSSAFPGWLSLLTCFHFGYHHEHHAQPGLPWWKLPEAHRGWN